jgi:BlaI family transcriptional regulator, penicillinase repressor
MKKQKEIPKPTEGELELLAILWERGEATVRDVFVIVNQRRPVVYTGVQKLMQIMLEKGHVVRDASERSHIYRPAVAKEETQRRFMRDLSDRFFAGRAVQLAMRALEMEQASEEELSEIRKLIAAKHS